MDQKARAASNRITQSRSAKNRSYVTNMVCWSSQFRRIFQSALRKRGVTGETLLQLLETRLDNVIFRLGLANTRSAARQLVSRMVTSWSMDGASISLLTTLRPATIL